MSEPVAFDTLAYTKRLRKAGISKKHAEAHSDALSHLNIASKRDLKELELRLVIKLGSIFVVVLGAFVTLGKLF